MFKRFLKISKCSFERLMIEYELIILTDAGLAIDNAKSNTQQSQM